MDATDNAIVQALREDSRLSMRKLAKIVHMTAPAVAERVRRLEDREIIVGYTIRVNQQKIAAKLQAYIDIIMATNQHESFLQFVESREEVRECHRLAGGEVCYLLKVEVRDQNELTVFLEELIGYANYRLNLVISSTVKDI